MNDTPDGSIRVGGSKMRVDPHHSMVGICIKVRLINSDADNLQQQLEDISERPTGIIGIGHSCHHGEKASERGEIEQRAESKPRRGDLTTDWTRVGWDW